MKRKHEIKEALRVAFPLTIPVLTGFLFLGIAYGVLMGTKGYSAIWSFLMSAIAFCGSMQFVAITLLTIVFNPLQAFLLSLTVNARHLFYGISVLKKYKGIGKIKPFLIYVLCDETFSIVSSATPPEEINKKWFYFWISFLNYLYWMTGSLLGGLLSSRVHFDTKGLDFVLTALFVVIFIEQWEEWGKRLPGFLGIACSCLCLVIFGPDYFIIPAMITILFALMLCRKKLGKEQLSKEIDLGETREAGLSGEELSREELRSEEERKCI